MHGHTNQELKDLMLRAYLPCPNINICSEAKWKPSEGHIPRGILGATAELEDVKLVMVFAEPGHPHAIESYDADLSAIDLMDSAMSYIYKSYSEGTDLFHRNVRGFMSEVFPQLSFDEQLRHIWLTEGRLCSVDIEAGGLRDRTCASKYLLAQINKFPNATVVAFGGKAQQYLRGLGTDAIGAYALSPPGANFKAARPSWESAISKVRAKISSYEE